MKPERIHSEEQLDDLLTRPSEALVKFIRSIPSPLLILGAGGKMGPTLAVRAQRAAEAAGKRLKVIAVSRFREPAARHWLAVRGVTTLSVDLLEPDCGTQLPDAENVVYLVGLKFGTRDNPSLTWAANTLAPAHVATRYPQARIVALSTGNVYPFVPVADGGAREDLALNPLGEYANAAIARERIFEYFAQKNSTRLALVRLNYAVELRYGILVDIARQVASGQPVDVTNGAFNCIWQGDANDLILRLLDHVASPPARFNLTGPAVFSVRATAMRFAELLGRPAQFVGTEAGTALLSHTGRLNGVLGTPSTDMEMVMRWIASWISDGGRSLGKPTGYAVRDGRY